MLRSATHAPQSDVGCGRNEQRCGCDAQYIGNIRPVALYESYHDRRDDADGNAEPKGEPPAFPPPESGTASPDTYASVYGEYCREDQDYGRKCVVERFQSAGAE